jgi:DNA anti-recombination protein RmuC
VEALGPDELKTLIDDPAAFMVMFQNLSICKEFHQKDKEMHDRVVEMAESNLGKERDLQNLREKLIAMHEQLAQLRTEYDNKVDQMREISQRFTPQAISTSLKIAVQEADEAAHRTLTTFMDPKGNMDSDTFVKQYTAERKLHHIRRAKDDQFNNGY